MVLKDSIIQFRSQDCLIYLCPGQNAKTLTLIQVTGLKKLLLSSSQPIAEPGEPAYMWALTEMQSLFVGQRDLSILA
jgi:hypothetical protein